jgi:hypothetical protein
MFLAYLTRIRSDAPKKINGFRIVRVEIVTVAYGSFKMTLLVYFLLHTCLPEAEVLAITTAGKFFSKIQVLSA